MKAYDALVAVVPSEQRSEHFEKKCMNCFGYTNLLKCSVTAPPISFISLATSPVVLTVQRRVLILSFLMSSQYQFPVAGDRMQRCRHIAVLVGTDACMMPGALVRNLCTCPFCLVGRVGGTRSESYLDFAHPNRQGNIMCAHPSLALSSFLVMRP